MRTPDLTHEEAEQRFSELLNYIVQNVSIVDVVRDSGVTLEPVCAGTA
jgi:hypothetical protein